MVRVMLASQSLRRVVQLPVQAAPRSLPHLLLRIDHGCPPICALPYMAPHFPVPGGDQSIVAHAVLKTARNGLEKAVTQGMAEGIVAPSVRTSGVTVSLGCDNVRIMCSYTLRESQSWP